MLYYRAALRNERRRARMQLIVATSASAGGNAPSDLYRKLED